MNLTLPTGRPGQICALALLFAVLALLWVSLFSPFLDWYADRAATLDLRGGLADRMQNAVAELPRLRAQAAALRSAGAGEEPTLLRGATDAVAAAELQAQVQESASSDGMRISSFDAVPVVQEPDGTRRVGLTVRCSGPYDALIRLLADLEQRQAHMLVEDLELHAEAAPSGAPGATAVDASFNVSAIRDPSTP